MDILSKDQRHKNMAAIHSANTKPEMIVRKYLFAHGFRYRLNHPRLPGRPDIVLRKYRTCIFINGCFWHGHEGCKYYVIPKSNTEFWTRNITVMRSTVPGYSVRLAMEMICHTGKISFLHFGWRDITAR